MYICLFILITSCLLTVSVKNVEAALQCNGCHGTLIPADYRPLDASYRNITTGGFQGSHRTHMGSPASASACGTCHPGSASYLGSHRDDKIKISSSSNGSPLTTLYKNSTTAWFQTATPTLGSCANINCHFESITPVWGSSPALTSCSTCHGAPPSGTTSAYIGGAAGSHAKHDQYYPDTGNCNKCHPDHTAEAAPFAHATSIGKRDIIIRPRDPLNNIHGSFSAGTRDYLPSQVGTHTYGTCNSTYCHSTVQAEGGTGAPAYGSPTWGASTNSCSLGCHRVGFHNSIAADGSPVNTSINTGSHSRHLAYPSNGVGSCSSCHLWTSDYKSGCLGSCHPGPHDGEPLVPPEIFAKHANGMIDVSFNPGYAASATYNGIATPMSKAPRTGYSTAKVTAAWGTTSKTRDVLTCIACHTDISSGALRTNLPIQPYTDDTYTNPDVGIKSNLCIKCHSGTQSGRSIKAKVAAGADFTNLAFIGSHSAAAAGILFKSIGYEFSGQNYSNKWHFKHDQIGISNFTAYNYNTGSNGPCVGCHMSSSNKHTFSPLTKDTGGVVTAVISTSCAGCHTGPAYLDAGRMNSRETKFAATLLALQKALETKNIYYADTAPYFFNSSGDTNAGNAVTNWGNADTMGAAFNFNLLRHEPGAYAHNMIYAKRLIYDSIDFLDNGAFDNSVSVTINNLSDMNATQKTAATGYLTPTGTRP